MSRNDLRSRISLNSARRVVFLARRTVRWGTSQGWARLIEEHDLNPTVRIPRLIRSRSWVRHHGGTPGSAVPLFLVGVQRSGTNMLTHGFDAAPQVEVLNEGSRRAFTDFRIKDLNQIRRLVDASPRSVVLLKPLCDSHRIDEMLDSLGTHTTPRAIWAWRGVDARVRSAVAKFPTSNIRILRQFIAGEAENHWQMQRLSQASLDFIRSLDVDRLSPESGAAVFWYVRNRLYFELGLDKRDDVMPVGYECFVSDPETWMRQLTGFLDLDYDPRLTAHVKPTAGTVKPNTLIDPQIRERCLGLQAALEHVTVLRRGAQAG